MMPDDPYSVLGVDRSASDAELRSAYRRRALETHPDKGGTAEAFRQVTSAFEILSDSDRRADFENARHMGKPADAAQRCNVKRRQPGKEHASSGAPFKHTKSDKAPHVSSSRAPSAAEANVAEGNPPRVPTYSRPTDAPTDDAKKFNVARYIQELYKLSQAVWAERLNELSDAMLVDVETFLREGGCMEGDGGDCGGEEDAGGAMVSLVVREDGFDEEQEEEDREVGKADQNEGAVNDPHLLSEGTSAMLALDRWDEDDVAGGGSDSETELVPFDDDNIQVPHMPAKEAKETMGGAVTQSEVAVAVPAANPTNEVTNDSRTRSNGGVTGTCKTPGSSKLPQFGRRNTRLCGLSKTKSGGYMVRLGIKYAYLSSNTCQDLNTAIDIHIYMIRLRQSMIERMQAGIEFADALRAVDALVTAERPHFENHVLRITYQVTYFGREGGRRINLSGQSSNVESAIRVWKESHQERHELQRQRRAEKVAIKEEKERKCQEEKQRKSREREQKIAQKQMLQFTKSLLFCVRRILGTRKRQREKAFAIRWGVRSLPEGVEPASLHQTDDCVRAVLLLSDGSLRRGPLRQSLKDAETDAEDLARLQSRRGDAAACAELERRDVAAMTGYFLELA
eukprot:TRINITY_DN14367_c0_g5_i1.p1 TRINITY_DN14367_c0_g5~~TRINITY_DN14367_c0_g5_i1.p1  ORF type:complete len:624 (+),score=118.90 TRINITY_DN14367_c0_g5_i1:117-1988(+)